MSAENKGKAHCVSLHTQHRHHGRVESLPPKPQAEAEVQPSFTGRLERDPVLLSPSGTARALKNHGSGHRGPDLVGKAKVLFPSRA